MENTDSNNSTIETLQTEREELLKQLDQIKNLTKENEENKHNAEVNSLKAENESLKKLIEEYKSDISNATKFAQQVMLEYGSRKQEIKQEVNQDSDLQDAQKALDDYIKQKMEVR